jgi:pantetheine-phosphate adenylyltransferase
VDYLFMMTSEDQYYVSSTLIREVAANGGSVEGLVPPHVEARLRARFGGARS